ncbi:hypothetical protein [Magnetofaba australis]|uniref:Uncharacterized protein n=1 Tax=Magnetofaba australis IT-1 TaxID=1434232 RepID=A0A1Y2K8P1_9PROT|nr:hypothetical protein [Magnetofaba australis]OSM06867.1 hypothetical protein MAIT1_00257 [Magnetofaba australis IT-1]
MSRDEQAQTPTEQPLPSPEQQARMRRRKLIKGLAASAPVIMTLSPGAALARSSSQICIANEPTSIPTGGNFAGNRCVTDNNVDANTNTQDGYKTWDRDKFTNYASNSATLTGGSAQTTDDCLIFVNEVGTVNNTEAESYGDGQANHHIVTDSCWGSFN